MKGGQWLSFLMGTLLVFMTLPLGAQNLLEPNPHTARARELRAQADAAIEAGEYSQALELAREAQQERELALTWAENQAWAYRANGMRNRAQEQLTRLGRINGQEHYPDQMALATENFAQGQAAFEAAEYQAIWENFRIVRDTLMDLRAVASPRPEPAAAAELPQYYTVRLIPDRRDCFWRIAEYDFVYGDGREWRRLYEANRHLIQDPENPDLIQPGMRFIIPAREGEVCAGDWQP